MKPTNPKSILIMGTGALGCLFSARLSAVGLPVAMYGSWVEGLAALREYGVRILEADGVERAYPVYVLDDPRDCYQAQFSIVLVKSWQTEIASRRLVSCLAEDGLALTLQNGLGNYELLAQVLGKERVALGTTTSGATLLGPGRVRPGGEGVISMNGNPQLEPLVDYLGQAGFKVQRVSDATTVLWSKLVISAAINPLTALLEVPNGELVERPNARRLMAKLASETAAVAAAKGISLPQYDPVEAAESVARRTAVNLSSMLQDIQRGAPTEIDAICGAIARVGEQAGIPTPINHLMWELVKAKVNQ